MQKNIKQYLSNLGMSNSYIELLDELDSEQLVTTTELFMTNESENYIEKGTKALQKMGDYEIFQIVQNEELTVFFLYREGESDALEPGRCLAFGYNNLTGDHSGVGTVPVVVEDGKFISIC